VLIACANYSFVALIDISFRTLQPVFFSTPIALGGLGLDPPVIGTIMAFSGALNGAFTIFFFSRMTDYFGVKLVYLMGMAAAVPCFSLFPILNLLARNSIERSGGLGLEVWVAVGLQVVMVVLNSMCCGTSIHSNEVKLPLELFPPPVVSGAVFIFIAAASPSKASLGATNGLTQLSVALVRTVGPALVSSMYSLSIDRYMNGGLVYCMAVGLSLGAVWVGLLLPRHPWKDIN